MKTQQGSNGDGYVSLAISRSALFRLLRNHQLHIDECVCLKGESKQLLSRLLMTAAAEHQCD